MAKARDWTKNRARELSETALRFDAEQRLGTAVAPKGVAALGSGVCVDCGDLFAEGDLIVLGGVEHRPRRRAHEGCDISADPHPATRLRLRAAQYPGSCRLCSAAFDVGETIAKASNGWAHSSCIVEAPAGSDDGSPD